MRRLPFEATFRRAVAANLAVQVFGPASSFLTVIVIARLGGPSDQGQYAQFKAWIDLLATIGCLGFPQGFIYIINKLRSSAAVLGGWSWRYSLAFVPVALAATAIALKKDVLTSSASNRLETVAALGLAAAVLVLHGLWRGIYLTHDPGARFAVFTILPAVSVLVGSTASMLVGWQRFDWVLLLSMLSTLLPITVMMRPILRDGAGQRLSDQPWRSLLSNGMHAFFQTLLMTLQPIVAYWLVRFHGGGNREIGFLNVGLFLVQGLSVPIAMVAPLLLDRWTSATDEGFIGRLNGLTWRIAPLVLISGGLLAAASRVLVPGVFGRDYANAVLPTAVMLVTVPLLWHVRVIEPALHARGRPGINTATGAVRVGVFAAGGMVVPYFTGQALVAIAAAWTVANVIAGSLTLIGLRVTARAEMAGGSHGMDLGSARSSR